MTWRYVRFPTISGHWLFRSLFKPKADVRVCSQPLRVRLCPFKLMVMNLPPIIQSYLDAYNRKDAEGLVDCVSDDVVFENVSNGGQSLKVEGRQAFSELATQAATMFSSRHQTVRKAVVDGDELALELDWTGTPAVDLGPMKAGVQVALRGASFFSIRDGKISRIVDLS